MTETPPMPAAGGEDDGLAFACVLDGTGGGKVIGWADVDRWTPDEGALWVHLNLCSDRAVDWLESHKHVSERAHDAITEAETRPRVFDDGNGIVAILRGVNLNPGAEPDDMVAVRIWADDTMVVSIRQDRLMTPRDILADLTERRTGPRDAPQLLVRFAERLTERINAVVVDLDEQLDDIEESLETEDHRQLRGVLTDVRQACVGLRRYLGPQREALTKLQVNRPKWIDDDLQNNLRDTSDRLQRYIEDLDAARDRAIVIRDEIANRMQESMNRTMYALSIVAGIFLPLGFVTGLLGINVGGMPGTDAKSAFWITCGLLVGVVALEVFIMKRLKWI